MFFIWLLFLLVVVSGDVESFVLVGIFVGLFFGCRIVSVEISFGDDLK